MLEELQTTKGSPTSSIAPNPLNTSGDFHRRVSPPFAIGENSPLNARVQLSPHKTPHNGEIASMVVCRTKVTGPLARRDVPDLELPAESAVLESPRPAPSNAPIRILRLGQVIEVTGLGKTKIYELQAAGHFPMRVQITAHTVGWVEHEVQAWLASRVATRSVLTVDPAPEILRRPSR